MEMASSEVEMSSCQTFNCVLNPHERCTRGDHNNKKKNSNNNNARNIHVAIEKNLNVFVRDHLDNCTVSGDGGDDSTKSVPEYSSSSKSSVSKTEDPSSSPSSLGSDLDPNFSNSGQSENSSRKETMAASSLVQIWEARTTQQPPSSNQNQSQIDSRTSSSASNTLENSESLNEESVKESDLIHQPIEEGNNEEQEEEMECDSQFAPPPPPPDSGEKEREGVRVMDIIRKLSNDSETPTNNDNGNSGNDNGKEVQTTEARCFPQVTCAPRIRGRQAFTDLLEQMTRDREKELACILQSHSVSKFTHRGRIQSVLRIRCYERCIAIQDSHRCKPSSAAGSGLNRSPRGSGVMNHLREKYKTNSENIETGALSSRGRILDKDPHKVTEKTTEKSDLKGTHQVVNSAVENAKKAVLREIAENKNGLKKFAGETIQKEATEVRDEKRETKEKPVAKETLEGRGEKRETKEKSVAKESLEERGERRETKEKGVAKESLEGRGESQETKEKGVAKESLEGRGEKRETKEKAIAKGSLEGKGENRETKEKAIAKESVEGNNVMGIAEKVNLWNSEEKMNRRNNMEKGNNTGKAEKNDVLEEATRRIINVESAERSITTSKETMARCEFGEKVRRKKKEDSVSAETKSKEIEVRNMNPQKVTAQVEEKVLQETTEKSDVKKPVEKESREERREGEESVEGNTMMGIAEKVNLWNAKEKKNRRRVMEKSKGKANSETNEVLQEASRRMINIETAERSLSTSKEMVGKVVGTQEVMGRRETSKETTQCESAAKGIRKKEEDFASVEAKSKEFVEDKNMNPQESASHGSREKAKEKICSQHGEEMSILLNSEVKSTKEIDRNNSQEVTEEEGSTSDSSREKNSSQQDEKMSILQDPNDGNSIKELENEETKKVEREEKEENVKEAAMEFVNDWDEDEMEEEDEYEYGDYDHYNDDWINDIARPRSYWENLRKERYLEVLNTKSEKKDICDLIESRTVSNFLTSDLRQKIDNLMISRVQGHPTVQINQEEEDEDEDEDEDEGDEDDEYESSAMNQEDNETEEEPEKTNLEAASDGCSQSSPRSCTMMMSWSFRDQDIVIDNEPTMSLSLPEPSVTTNQSTQEMQMISDLRGQMEQLQREMIELRNSVKSCIDMQLHFQKSVTQDPSSSGGSSAEQGVETRKDPLKRKCCVCSEMPVDSLLYRCGHMCTCLKCAHELQWSSKKCPICMAPIVDVVRAFLDS